MTTINETVQQTLTERGYGSYSSYAEPVVTALVNREQQIVGQIIEFATQQGLPQEQARDMLASMGMEVPTQAVQDPGPTAEGDQPDVGATLRRIEEQLSGLTSFARENGYRG